MRKKRRKNILSSLADLDFLEDLAPSLEESPFKKALKRYFAESAILNSKQHLQQEMQLLRKALKEMDEAKMAHALMQETRKKLQSAYQELLEKSKA